MYIIRLLLLSIALIMSTYANAQQQKQPQEWNFKADNVIHENNNNVIIATGNVIISQKNRRIKADKVIYDEKNKWLTAIGNVLITDENGSVSADKIIYHSQDGLVTAIGNVLLTDENGNQYASDYSEISNDFKTAIIQSLQARLKQYGILEAKAATRDGNFSYFQSPSYSACKKCAEDPSKPLLWQLKAKRVVHDQKEKTLKYYSAHLRFLDVPIFYTPYFSYPDPSVKRKRGFLIPRIGGSRNTGTYISVPYFVPIGEHSDVTANPIFTSEGGQIATAYYRGRFNRAAINSQASYTSTSQTRNDPTNTSDPQRFDKNRNRWHVYFESTAHINENIRGGINVRRTSDNDYFRRYPFWDDPGNFLQSSVSLERFSGRNYANVTAFSFQDLRSTNRAATPEVYPNIDSYFYGNTDARGGHWKLYSNLRFHQKDKLVRDSRIYLQGGYELPVYASAGYITTFDFNLYGYSYISDFQSTTNSFGNSVHDENVSRLLPQLGARWNMPFERTSSNGKQIIEPIIAIYAAPNSANNRNVNNSDATIFTIQNHNIFAANRFNGIDRFDGGQRLAYGVNLESTTNITHLKGFIGQVYEFSEDPVLKEEFGIGKGVSDIVTAAQLDTSLPPNWRFLWDNQANADNDSGEFNRYFTQASVDNDHYRLSANYLFVGRKERVRQQKQINLQGEMRLDKNWRFGAFSTVDWSQQTDASKRRGVRQYGSHITFENECFYFRIAGSRDFIKSPDIDDGFSLLLTFNLKTLGGVDNIHLDSLAGY